MTFNPAKINLQHSQYQCEHRGRKSVCVTTELCFVYSIKSDNKDLSSAAREAYDILCWFPPTDKLFFFILTISLYPLCPAVIHYNLTLDALRAKARASFIDRDDKNDRRITRNFTIKDAETKCLRETFMMSASTFRLTSCISDGFFTWDKPNPERSVVQQHAALWRKLSVERK